MLYRYHILAIVLRGISFMLLQNVLYTLGQLTQEFPEVAKTLNVRLQEADLKLPTKPPTRGNGSVKVNVSSKRTGNVIASSSVRSSGMNDDQSIASSTGSYVQPRTMGMGL